MNYVSLFLLTFFLYRQRLRREFDEALKENQKDRFIFIFRSLRPVDLTIFNDALMNYSHIPMAILNVCDDKFCFSRIKVPKEFVNDKFDATIWANDLFKNVIGSVKMLKKSKESATITSSKDKAVDSNVLLELVEKRHSCT